MVSNKKQYYTIKLEIIAPVQMQYKIFSENPEKALEEVEKNIARNLAFAPKPIIGKGKKSSVKVYKAGTTNILLNKKY